VIDTEGKLWEFTIFAGGDFEIKWGSESAKNYGKNLERICDFIVLFFE
jgi:hypothetical protein